MSVCLTMSISVCSCFLNKNQLTQMHRRDTMPHADKRFVVSRLGTINLYTKFEVYVYPVQRCERRRKM